MSVKAKPRDTDDKKRVKNAPSTPPTPSTNHPVENVEGVEAQPSKPILDWYQGKPLHENFRMVGRALAILVPQLYRHTDDGLLLVEDNRPRRIKSAKELSPLLIDHIYIRVWKENGNRAERLSQTVLADMLGSRSFLGCFEVVQDIATSPVVRADGTPSEPGFNPGGVLYLGPNAEVGKGTATITKFLDVMEFDGNASRTNAVAAALTVLFRHHWYGAKPLVLVTANKSHSGKGTLCNFVGGTTAKADILYQNRDWPMEQALQKQLTDRPEIGVIVFDNVRLGSSGGGTHIRSGLFESFITNSEIVLSSAKLTQTFRSLNKYIVLLNTNEGVMSADFLNRGLPINLNASGDMEERLARAKEKLGGDVKTEWLPAHQVQIQAEFWGMIDAWVKKGKPMDEKVKYPMAPWAKTLGGILTVNGFADFLGNYMTTRAAVDPIREAIGYLAFYASHEVTQKGLKALPTKELGRLLRTKLSTRCYYPASILAMSLPASERSVGGLCPTLARPSLLRPPPRPSRTSSIRSRIAGKGNTSASAISSRRSNGRPRRRRAGLSSKSRSRLRRSTSFPSTICWTIRSGSTFKETSCETIHQQGLQRGRPETPRRSA